MSRLAAALFAVALVVACRSEAPPVEPASPAAPAVHEALTRDGSFLVRIATSPSPIPFNEPFTVDVDVFDASEPQRRLDDATAVVDGWMPDHGHGMNRFPKVESRDGGGLRARGMLFHMLGLWELNVDVIHEGLSSRATFEFTL